MWWNNLMNGALEFIDVEVQGFAHRYEAEIQGAKRLLNTPDASTSDYLDAAHRIQEVMKKRSDLYASWLASEFKHLDDYVKYPDVLEALKELHAKGVALMTTNYDGLLEKYCGLQALDSRDDRTVHRWRRGSSRGYVFHPHGFWNNPDKVVLSARDYYDVVNDDVIQDTLKAILADKTVLFIGSGGGLGDPNFGQLLQWIGNKYANLGARHYVLLPEDLPNPVPELPLNIVRCRNFQDQSRWLMDLLGEGVSREGTTYEIPKRSERAKINHWLGPTDQTQVIRATLDRLRTPFELVESVTGSPTVWNAAGSSLVLVRGPEGFGKTMLCSYVIESTRRACRPVQRGRSRDSLAYFLCDPTHNFSAFCRTLIDQLCPPNEMFPVLRELYTASTRFHPATAPTAPQLHDALLRILTDLCPEPGPGANATEPGETYLIIDGLDHIQTNERDAYLKLIRDITQRRFQYFHLLVSYRILPRVTDLLSRWVAPDVWREINCNAATQRNAREHYLRQCVDTDPQFQPVSPTGANPRIGLDIIDIVLNDGRSFAWVSRKIKRLKREIVENANAAGPRKRNRP
ncbi:SIR2-like domain-containing protein [Hypoxylon cercidicola]|nr:SIR2-like domain-containing protein [Hypoxylon cercidicola]